MPGRAAAMTLDGLTSRVTSASGATSNVARTSAINSAIRVRSSRPGVPPPTKTVRSVSAANTAPRARTSARSAATYSCWPFAPATDTKSQYSHFLSQNGMCRYRAADARLAHDRRHSTSATPNPATRCRAC